MAIVNVFDKISVLENLVREHCFPKSCYAYRGTVFQQKSAQPAYQLSDRRQILLPHFHFLSYKTIIKN